MQRDLHKPGLGGMNTDDNPSVLPPGDYPDGLNIRTGSSSEKHGTGNVETLQGEIELLLGVEALTYYYGSAIGGEFIYSGYEEVTIGTQSWMKRNWDYNYPGSKVYDDVEANASIYGRLYNHQQVMASNFSPPGWRVPTEADIDTLLTYLGGQMIAGGKMKEVGTDHWNTPNTSADDISGFRALPGGEFDTVFDLLGEMGLFWLQDEAAPTTPTALPATDIDTTTFLANWQIETGPTGYYLDVATDAAFTAFVAGFNNLNVGLVSAYNVTGLAPDTTYYYRVRAYNEIGASASSNTITLDTVFAVADIDGNIYTVVTIGALQWMVENLKTTKYADGVAIPNIISNGSDWFLPSKDELNQMWVNLGSLGIGGFAVDIYWSSSEDVGGSGNAWDQSFFGAGVQALHGKGNAYSVRACHTFVAAVGSYALGDAGPEGGWIFYIDGTTYWECAPVDQSNNQTWSNIVVNCVGAQFTAIGTGVTNTVAVIAQVGHVASAAKLCDDLVLDGWVNDVTGARCWYNNDIANKAIYGAIYNWFAVDSVHGLAPAGWRVATSADYTALVTALGGDAIAGGKLKEIGITHWNAPNTGATNEYGFRAVPNGARVYDTGGFISIGNSGYVWTATQTSATHASSRVAVHDGTTFPLGSIDKNFGLAVRCCRDVP